MIEFFGKLGEYLGFPVNASEHGLIIDHMNGWIHWLMLILFIVLLIFGAGKLPDVASSLGKSIKEFVWR